ncbi:hypothetical protein BDB01DRAFT_375540 [Pilobolus umbonatus]|nr:hypothetical protein BDB01DRAFT_375540 [Pilobolus umbonatus]
MITLSFLSLFMIASCIQAEMAPSYPEPGTVWKAGKEYTISWYDDEMNPHMKKNWKNFKIDFMTGDNHNQKFIRNVVKGLDASKTNEYKWLAPEVDPHSAIYFLMFTNDKGMNAWTTRFGITGEDGKLDPPQHDTQPNGDSIPWGIGKLRVTQLSTKPNQTYSMSPAMSSAMVNNAAIVIATSNASSVITPLFTLTTLIAMMLAICCL